LLPSWIWYSRKSCKEVVYQAKQARWVCTPGPQNFVASFRERARAFTRVRAHQPILRRCSFLDEVVGWIRPFIEYVEEQTGAEAPWEPFNTKNALHQPPERCWVESGAAAGAGPAEKLEGLQAFLRLASGGGNTFLDKGHRFALKRYPHAGEPESAESVGGEFYAAENQHINEMASKGPP